MKKIILALSVAALLVSVRSTAFGQNKKAMDAKEDSIEDIQKFKKRANEEIAENKTKIAKLKTEKKTRTAEDKAKYDKKVAELEEKNNALERKINNYNEPDKSKWASFKREFKHDMDELGHAIKDIGVDNEK
jgi:septal ring factor EnvC (AmiA/AmiB activator)